ncbi:hypothetical protein HY489_04610 [Candidatus Woesearchaeota archaeon]|nr:hypothetical protein [Candidatus Woesearchaeota archaeon]
MKISIRALFSDWVVQEVGSFVLLWFRAKRGNHNRKSFVFPKEITIDDTFAEAIGMYIGDGDMHRKEKSHLSYVSKDVDIATFVLNFLRQKLLIRNEDVTLSVHHGTIRPDIPMLARSLRYEPYRIKARFFERNRYPSVHIQVNGKIFRLVFERIVDCFLKSDFLSSDGLRRGFLRGLFAAEGGIAVMYKEMYINQITFTLSSKEDYFVSFLRKGLDLENISFKTVMRKNFIETIIQNWRNYLKCWQIGLFDRCARKKEKFLSIAKQCKVSAFLSKGDLQKLSARFTQQEIAEIIGSHQGNVCRTLQGKFLFQLDHVRKFQKMGMPLKIQKLRVGCLTELPYSEETTRLFCAT